MTKLVSVRYKDSLDLDRKKVLVRFWSQRSYDRSEKYDIFLNDYDTNYFYFKESNEKYYTKKIRRPLKVMLSY